MSATYNPLRPLGRALALLRSGGPGAVWRRLMYRRRRHGQAARSAVSTGPGVLLAAGLITGEALVGILLAIPIVLAGGKNPLDVGLEGGPPSWPCAVRLLAVMAVLYAVAVREDADTPPEPPR